MNDETNTKLEAIKRMQKANLKYRKHVHRINAISDFMMTGLFVVMFVNLYLFGPSTISVICTYLTGINMMMTYTDSIRFFPKGTSYWKIFVECNLRPWRMVVGYKLHKQILQGIDRLSPIDLNPLGKRRTHAFYFHRLDEVATILRHAKEDAEK